MDDEILKTLLKKATGYSRDEVQEEYAVSAEGEMTLVKRKVTKKYYPPDSTALKTYLELSSGRGTEEMSDEELEAEKRRLAEELFGDAAPKAQELPRGTKNRRGDERRSGNKGVKNVES